MSAEVELELDRVQLDWIDGLVRGGEYESRSAVIDAAFGALRGEFLKARKEIAEARTALCDLLWGRWIRARAADLLEQALWTESQGATAASVQHLLETAAHWEWIAAISERGQLMWGMRNNRCGRAEDDEHGVDSGAQMRG